MKDIETLKMSKCTVALATDEFLSVLVEEKVTFVFLIIFLEANTRSLRTMCESRQKYIVDVNLRQL